MTHAVVRSSRRIVVGGMAAIAMALSGCMPMTGTDPAGPVAGSDAAACAARGGTLKAVGRMQTMQCIVKYADAGKACTDGDQCAGDCRVEGNDGLDAGAVVAGECQVDSDRFGCYTRVEDGKATATICVD